MKIGLTGGVGCGASEAARFLAEQGIGVVSGDRCGHLALESDSVKAQLIDQFSENILTEDKKINRSKLGLIVFADEVARRRLNDIIHPTLLDILKKQVDFFIRQDGVVVVDAALIFEWGVEAYFDKIVVVTASLETRLHRVMQRDGLNREQILQRIQAQIPIGEKATRADYVITNDATLAELHDQVQKIWQKIIPNDSTTNPSVK